MHLPLFLSVLFSFRLAVTVGLPVRVGVSLFLCYLLCVSLGAFAFVFLALTSRPYYVQVVCLHTAA